MVLTFVVLRALTVFAFFKSLYLSDVSKKKKISLFL